jgi:hypothetical protein
MVLAARRFRLAAMPRLCDVVDTADLVEPGPSAYLRPDRLLPCPGRTVQRHESELANGKTSSGRIANDAARRNLPRGQA